MASKTLVARFPAALSFSVTDDMKAEIDGLAERYGVSQAEVAREAIYRGLPEARQAFKNLARLAPTTAA